MTFTKGDDAAGGGGSAPTAYGELYIDDDNLSQVLSTTYAQLVFNNNANGAVGLQKSASVNTTSSLVSAKMTGNWLVMAALNIEIDPAARPADSVAKVLFEVRVNDVAASPPIEVYVEFSGNSGTSGSSEGIAFIPKDVAWTRTPPL